MKKQVLSVMCTLTVVTLLFLVSGTELRAREKEQIAEGAQLTHDDESIGYSRAQTRGQYLELGYSKVAKGGAGIVYAGGTTIASRDVEIVQISAMLERCKKEGEPWYFVEGWHKESKNTNLVSISERMEVEGGWYYRVRSTHSANSDVSSSFTNGIFIPKP